MIVVTGHLSVDPADRHLLLAASQSAVHAARGASGCLDFAVSPDPIDPGRVNVAERWADRTALQAFREAGPDEAADALVTRYDVAEYEVPCQARKDSPDLGNANQDSSDQDGETAIAALVTARVAAVAAKDLVPIAASLADDVESFNVLPPLRLSGADVVIEQTHAWYDGFASNIGYDVSELRITASGAVGFASYTYRVTGTLRSGQAVDMTVRATLGCRRRQGRWLITHDHESVPFDPDTPNSG